MSQFLRWQQRFVLNSVAALCLGLSIVAPADATASTVAKPIGEANSGRSVTVMNAEGVPTSIQFGRNGPVVAGGL